MGDAQCAPEEHPSLFQLAAHLDLRYFCAIFVGLLLFTIFFEHVLEKHVIISFTLTPTRIFRTN